MSKPLPNVLVHILVLALLALALFAQAPADAELQEVSRPTTTTPLTSVFAVMTHKAGFASSRAHNHIIVASDLSLALDFDAAYPLETSIRMKGRVENLLVDEPKIQQQLGRRMVELGVFSEVPTVIDRKSRKKIAQSMLGPKQLEAELFPHLEAHLRSLEPAEKAIAHGGVRFGYHATVALEVHGRTRESIFDARLERHGERVVLEAIGTFEFTDFAVEPFSAFFGAVKNENTFHAYARLEVAAPP